MSILGTLAKKVYAVTSDLDTRVNQSSARLSSVESAIDDLGGGVTFFDDYSEPTFTEGVLTSTTTWTSDGGTKVSSKTFSYTSGNLTSVVEKDGSDAVTLTKTLTYDSSGNLESITKDYA